MSRGRMKTVAFFSILLSLLASLALPAGSAQARPSGRGEALVSLSDEAQGGAADVAAAPSAEPLAPQATDSFGYLSESYALQPVYPGNPDLPSWVDESLGVKRDVTFGYPFWDNAISGPITIGVDQNTPGLYRQKLSENPDAERLPFRFYDGEYTTLYISINGVIRFANETSNDNHNYPIPTGDLSPAAPTNFIAAIWGDLDANNPLESPSDYHDAPPWKDTRVYVQYLDEYSPFVGSVNAFVITWENLYRRGAAPEEGVFTFQVVLKDNGDIYVNIKEVPNPLGNLTIGIEDDSGDDGLLSYYNGAPAGSLAMKSFAFKRPSPDYRMRVSPKLQGQLMAQGKTTFPIQVKNITEVEGTIESTDIYNFTADAPGGWMVRFLDENMQALGDYDGDLNPDTNLVSVGEERTVYAQVTAPSGAPPGTSAEITVRVRSFQSGYERQVQIQAAVPTAFAHAYSDGTGTYLGLTWQLNQARTRLAGFSGDELAVDNLSHGFVYTWSELDPLFGDFFIHFSFLNALGFQTQEGVIPHGQGETDNSPALAADPSSDSVALVWVRAAGAESQVWYAILDPNDPDGIAAGPTRLVGGSGKFYRYPAAAVQRNASGRFSLAWVVKEAGVSQIQVCVVERTSGVQGCNLAALPAATSEEIYGLSFEGLAGSSGDTLLFYADTSEGSPKLRYIRLAGTTRTAGPTLISDQVSLDQITVSSALVKNNHLMVAWLNPNVNTPSYPLQGVSYKVLNGSTLAQSAVYSLYAPNLTNADYISLSADKDGNAVLLWTDTDTYRYLYYALVDPGNPAAPLTLTNAMLIQALPSGSTISLSGNGQGLAAYSGRYDSFLPFLRK